MVLGSTQPQTECVPRILPGGKDGRYVELITLPPSSASCLKFWEPQSSEAQRACTGLNRDCLYLLLVVVGRLSVFEHASPLPVRTN